MVKMSKKGQGLALISILVLIAILYFVFRYNTQSYNFIIESGDEQAHLATAYTESAKVHSFVQLSARQAAFETIWNLSNKSKEGSALANCTSASFPSEFKSLFDTYSAMYAPTTDLIETSIPDYNFSFTCPSNTLQIEGWGHSKGCKLNTNFPFPQNPCEDQPNRTSCDAIKFTQNYPGKACTWTADLNCTDSLLEPDCSGKDEQSCNNYCRWQESYSEPIHIVSAPLINYQFSIDSDAHFIENINGSEYVNFTKARTLAFLPSCNIIVPDKIISNAKFNISVKYTDDGAPSAIDFRVTHSFVQNILANLSTLSESDPSDKVYDNGKYYYYEATLANNTYGAEVTCIDSDSNNVTIRKDFTISPV